MRPKGLDIICVLMCIMNLAGFAFVIPKAGDVATQYILLGVIVVLAFLVLWSFREGKNWARILVLLTSAIALLNLFLLGEFNSFQRFIVVSEALLAGFLLWWLNTDSVLSFFKGKNVFCGFFSAD